MYARPGIIDVEGLNSQDGTMSIGCVRCTANYAESTWGSLEITGRVEDKIESENGIHDTTLFSRLRNLSFRSENSMNDSTLFSRVRNLSFRSPRDSYSLKFKFAQFCDRRPCDLPHKI